MAQKRFQPEEIINELRHADVLLGREKKEDEIVKALGLTDVTYYRWRQEFGGMSAAQTKRLKELKWGNAHLQKAIADLTLGPDNEPMWMRLYVLPIGDRWAATILADTAEPPVLGELKGLSFFGDTPAEVERLALDYLGERVAQN